MEERSEFEVWQNDEMVASTSGPRDEARREAMNYAKQYAEDGPVQIFEVTRTLVPNMTDRERFEEWANLSIGMIERSTEPGYTHQYEDSSTQIAWAAWDAATKAEREACAKVCDDIDDDQGGDPIRAGVCADAIRARSNK